MNYQRNEAGNAELFAVTFGEKVRYDHSRKSWFQFQTDHGRRWIQDDTNYVRYYAVEAAEKRRALAVTISDEKEQKAQFKYASDSKNVRNIDATLKLAASMPGIAFDKTWDANPLLFQCENGVIDLQTGKLRDAEIEDYLLLRSSVVFDADAKCPEWEKFLAGVFERRPETIEYVQQAVGYSLTGLVKEQALFCVFGEAGTGKSVFLRVLSALLGDYGTPINKEILYQAANRIVGDGANLPGKRFATASEASGKGELDIDKIKAWTGSEEMIARELYKAEYRFQPQFKLWLSFNSRPTVIDHTDGIWRRLKMVPFDHQFKGEERNFEMFEILEKELSGILNWAIEGCMEWQKLEHGIQAPESIEKMNQAYRDDFNPFMNFITDECVLHSDVSCRASDFYKRYASWCKGQEEKPISKQKVAEQLRAMGIRKEKPTSGVRQHMYYGVELNRGMTLNEALAAAPAA